jgi:hypothetical protein
MNIIQIHYYLKTPGGDYASLEEYIKGLGAWAHIPESLWLVHTSKSIVDIRDEMAKRMRASDRVLVLDVTVDSWASSNVSSKITSWMHEQLGTVPVTP